MERRLRYLGLSGEGFGLRGGGVRGTAGLGAMDAAGIKPWTICFYTTHTQGEVSYTHGLKTHKHKPFCPMAIVCEDF